MTANEAIEILKNERECVATDCDRDCGKCPLVREEKDILKAFDMAITALEQQEKSRWIPVAEGLPEERDSIFAKYKGTDKWRKSMFERSSTDVIVTTEFLDRTRTTETLSTIDGKWNERELKYPERKVIAWMPLPKPYKEVM